MVANQNIARRHVDVGESQDLEYLEKNINNENEQKAGDQNLSVGVDKPNQLEEKVVWNDEEDQDKNREENYGVVDDNIGGANYKNEEGQGKKEDDYVNDDNGVDLENGLQLDNGQEGDDGANPDHNDDHFSKEMAKLDFMEKNRNARALSKDPQEDADIAADGEVADDAEIADNGGVLLPPADGYDDDQGPNDEAPGEIRSFRGREVL